MLRQVEEGFVLKIKTQICGSLQANTGSKAATPITQIRRFGLSEESISLCQEGYP